MENTLNNEKLLNKYNTRINLLLFLLYRQIRDEDQIQNIDRNNAFINYVSVIVTINDRIAKNE